MSPIRELNPLISSARMTLGPEIALGARHTVPLNAAASEGVWAASGQTLRTARNDSASEGSDFC